MSNKKEQNQDGAFRMTGSNNRTLLQKIFEATYYYKMTERGRKLEIKTYVCNKAGM